MYLRTTTLAALVVTMIAVASSSAQTKQDRDSLQGSWNLVGVERGGNQVGEDKIKEVAAVLTFSGTQINFKTPMKESQGSFQLRPEQKPPEIDIDIQGNDKTGKGIYHLQGSDLQICIDVSGKADRPREFKTQADSAHVLYRFKRSK